MVRGRFISFEGGEGAGKTTQINLLKDYLEEKGQQVILTREPGGSPGGEDIRKLLVTGDPDRWDAETEILLFYAARRNHVKTLIEPALEKGCWVLSDRFYDSTIAYQSYGHGIPLDYVQKVHDLAIGSFAPDLTFIMDIDPKLGLSRALSRNNNGEDRFERVDFTFHERLRNGFLKIASNAPQRCKIIDANNPIDDIQATLKHYCTSFLQESA